MAWRTQLVAIVCLLAGCTANNECDAGDDQCSGNTAMNCQRCAGPACGRWWETQDCGQTNTVCVEDSRHGAFCALSSMPDPRCRGDNYVAGYCDGDVMVHCTSSGFATSRNDCSATQKTCAHFEQLGPSCALSADPDPRCADLPDGTGQVCDEDGAMVLSCREGFAWLSYACENPCRSFSTGGAFCPVFAEPDPLCDESASSSELHWQCLGNATGVCDHGFVVQHKPCDAESACMESESYAFCVSSGVDAGTRP